ncbi:hypothetical protein [Ralstonia pseudosolanacearum]|uniref:hypothetical protein n=1 Tax=Ralstonia pseudosolanacearum TaxID=1310165 RepID=UPI0013C33BB9|nr:hypothetical protein [Ralstonia pseudosolanacearum]
MEIGQTAQVTIFANAPWNDTGVDFEQGALYQLTAEGEWFDAWIKSNADGYDSNIWLQQHFKSVLRLPAARWFCLVGAIGHELDATFQIGCSRAVAAPSSGRLFCFANDVPGFYFNNFGSVQLTIRRES